MELTIRSRGPAIRAEAAAEDRLAALDLALAKLDSRLRRALDRRKNHYGAGGGAVTGASAAIREAPRRQASQARSPSRRPPARAPPVRICREQAGPEPDRGRTRTPRRRDSVVPIKMEGDGPLVVRQKFHHAKPISIDQALLEMELVGHDFYLFHDIEEDTPSVVYRRHGYQYGVIRLIENCLGPRSRARVTAGGPGGAGSRPAAAGAGRQPSAASRFAICGQAGASPCGAAPGMTGAPSDAACVAGHGRTEFGYMRSSVPRGGAAPPRHPAAIGDCDER